MRRSWSSSGLVSEAVRADVETRRASLELWTALRASVRVLRALASWVVRFACVAVRRLDVLSGSGQYGLFLYGKQCGGNGRCQHMTKAEYFVW